MPQHGKSPRTASSALSVWMVLPYLGRRVPKVTGGSDNYGGGKAAGGHQVKCRLFCRSVRQRCVPFSNLKSTNDNSVDPFRKKARPNRGWTLQFVKNDNLTACRGEWIRCRTKPTSTPFGLMIGSEIFFVNPLRRSANSILRAKSSQRFSNRRKSLRNPGSL